MRRRLKCCVFLLLFLCATSALAARAREMSVQVRSGQIRSTPSFLGQIVAPVEYGDRVTVLSEQGAWSKVASPEGAEGWIHTSALTKKKIVLRAGDEDVSTGASSDELALAGKGFNSDVEAQFKAENKDIDFTWVDTMETWVVDPQEMQRFLKEGGVIPPMGGAQ